MGGGEPWLTSASRTCSPQLSKPHSALAEAILQRTPLELILCKLIPKLLVNLGRWLLTIGCSSHVVCQVADNVVVPSSLGSSLSSPCIESRIAGRIPPDRHRHPIASWRHGHFVSPPPFAPALHRKPIVQLQLAHLCLNIMRASSDPFHPWLQVVIICIIVVWWWWC